MSVNTIKRQYNQCKTNIKKQKQIHLKNIQKKNDERNYIKFNSIFFFWFYFNPFYNNLCVNDKEKKTKKNIFLFTMRNKKAMNNNRAKALTNSACIFIDCTK